MLLSCCLLPVGVTAQVTAGSLFESLPCAPDVRAAYEAGWRQLDSPQRESYEFLLRHMPKEDVGKVAAAALLETVRFAHQARAAVPWGGEVADDMFRNYVLPYAQANETREAWRPEMVQKFLPFVRDCKTSGTAARKLNETIFDLVDVHYSTERRRADQSPSESIEQGKASCTGLSILLADACRACCVPARLISVRWPHKRGNHTWVEVWDGQAWRFVGADEPDPKGFDRAWFVGDAQQCQDADRDHRIWAVSFEQTGEQFTAGWGPQMWGHDVTSRYAGAPQGGADDGVRAQIDRFLAADPKVQAEFSFDRNLDEELKTKAGDKRLRGLVWQSIKAHEQKALQADHDANRVRAGGKESPFTVKQVGEKPVGGWPLVIAMHGGGGVPKSFNDSQWRHMQIYYKDHPEASGYLYCALRAPTDEWNGFYTDYFYPVMEKLIRQFVVCRDVNPDRVIAIGYSHGGYGAFAVGTKMPYRFSAVHASAAAPTDGQCAPDGLHSLRFSFMVGGRDTAYGRSKRCQSFDSLLSARRQNSQGDYPYTFTFVEDCGHGGLPDRDLLPQLLPHVRKALPTRMQWRLTDAVIEDHYWVRVRRPQPGKDVLVYRGDDGAIHVRSSLPIELLLDARLIDMTAAQVVLVSAPRKESGAEQRREFTPAPSLRTLCQTMVQRGDPQLAASWVLPIE